MNAAVGTSQLCTPSAVYAVACSCSSSANASKSWRVSLGNGKNGLMTNLRIQQKQQQKKNNNCNSRVRIEANMDDGVVSLGLQATQKDAIFSRRSSSSLTVRRCKTLGSKQALQNVMPSSRAAQHVQRRSILRCQAAEEEPTVDNSSVLVVGGGGIGLETFKALSSAGSWVTVYQRSDKFRKDIESLGAMLAIGDVLDAAAIEKTFKSNTFDAVVVTVGGGTAQPEVDKDGPINFIDAAKKAGVKRFIMVSSIGAGDSKAAVDDKTYSVLEKVLIAKEAAEEYLRASGLEYTIIRPGGLLSGAPPSGKGVLTEDPTVAGLISRTDVATLIFKILFDKRTISKTYSAIDIEKVFPGRPTENFETLSLA